MKIEDWGTYLKTDEKGYLIPEVSEVLIQDKWKPVIKDYVEGFKNFYGENLHSIYVRGSVAKGKAIDGISDLDGIVITNTEIPVENRSWVKGFRESLIEKYSFIQDVEVSHKVVGEIEESRDKILIKLQSLCVYGEDVRDTLEKIKPGKNSAIHIFKIEKDIDELIFDLENKDKELDNEKIKEWCSWIMKRILRSSHELVAERSQKFTRDLYKCWEGFSEYYPEQKDFMYEILELAINPTDDREEIISKIRIAKDFLIKEGNNKGFL